ncbi:MAG: hypothetical protein ACYDGM_12165 [Vulcanimicrobiaceae bacterium]
MKQTLAPVFFIQAWNVRNDKSKRFGPFTFVQFTYDVLRTDKNEDEYAVYDPNCQANNPTDISTSPDGWIFPGGFIASDFVIETV